MAQHSSKQTQQWEAVGHAPLKPNELGGRVRIAHFEFKANRDGISAVVAQNDTVRLCSIPAGARLIGGKFKAEAFGASTTLDFGLRDPKGSGYIDLAGTVADDPDAIATLLTTPAAGGTADLFDEVAYLFYETEKELELYCTFAGANPADDNVLAGHILFVVD